MIKRLEAFNMMSLLTHLDWPSGIDLGHESVLILKVSGSIITAVNLGGLI